MLYDLALYQVKKPEESKYPWDYYKKIRDIPAAEAFYRFYKTASPDDPDLPIALYNAAVSYKLADKPKTAIALFKEFTEKKTKAKGK